MYHVLLTCKEDVHLLFSSFRQCVVDRSVKFFQTKDQERAMSVTKVCGKVEVEEFFSVVARTKTIHSA